MLTFTATRVNSAIPSVAVVAAEVFGYSGKQSGLFFLFFYVKSLFDQGYKHDRL